METLFEAIKENFKRWDYSHGPFGSEEEMREDMARFAKELSGTNAYEFVTAILWMMENDYPHLEVVYDFIDIYVQESGEALAQALLEHITHEGPPLLVELVGATKSSRAVAVLKERVPIKTAVPELIQALACALGEIGGEEAVTLLCDLQKLRMPEEIMKEIEIAFRNIATNLSTGMTE